MNETKRYGKKEVDKKKRIFKMQIKFFKKKIKLKEREKKKKPKRKNEEKEMKRIR